MKNKWRYSVLLATLLCGLLLININAAPVFDPPVTVDVDPALRNQIQADDSTGYLIYFREKADLSPAYTMDWQTRGQFVVKTLQSTAVASQQTVRAFLDAQGAHYQAFWIDNVIVVEESDRKTFDALTMAFPHIAALRVRQHPILYEPAVSDPIAFPLAVEPNLTRVKADQVWALGYTGQGIVVANIDTGVRYTHQALVTQYRGNLGGGTFNHNYNWWDPYLRTSAPNGSGSAANHGSHTMGTMVGDDGGANKIGIAPGARWIACKTFAGGNTDAQLLECGQFMAAPWDLTGANANPNLRPHIVNNSWGNCDQTYNSWYAGVINAWHATGIYPVFSNGNASNCSYPTPPGLNTVGNPARSGNVTAVGSTGKNNGLYATHSNWGPTDNPDTVNPRGYPDLKPQVVAPGVSIRSAYVTSDTAYGSMTGTSMSAPHVSGLVALLWSAAPCLIGDYAATETIIEETATPIYYNDLGTGARWPNYATGWGEINALAAVELAIVSCDEGALVGQVTDADTTTPIAGARVAVSSAAHQPRLTFTDSTGMYALKLHSGVYTLTASAYGYATTVLTGITHTVGVTTTQNVTLTPFAWYTVTGYVTDSATGWPLYAKISAGGDTWTDPVSGYYRLSLPGGVTHTLNVVAWVEGYLPKTITLPPLTADTTRDVGLEADATTCRAPGYSFAGTFLAENFDARTPPALGDWATVIVSGANPAWATRNGTRYPAGQTAHTLPNLVFFNSYSVLSGGSARLYRIGGVDMTTFPAHWLSWWMYHDRGYPSYNDRVQTQVSTDGGASWINVGAAVSRNDGSTGWKQHTLDLSAYNTQTDLRVGFLGISAYGNDIHIDDVYIGDLPVCISPAAGGLVVGQVYDYAGVVPLAGARVENVAGWATVTRATLDDPVVADSFYTLFSPAGAQVFTATLPLYAPDSVTVTVRTGDTAQQDFHLPAGRLTVTPAFLHSTVTLGSADTLSLTLANIGSWPADWEFGEESRGWRPAETFPAFVIPLASNVLWLSEAPVSGTLPAGSAQIVDVRFDAGVPAVAYPGDYYAELQVNAATPYVAPTVSVTLTVLPPPSYGKLKGAVVGLGVCDAYPAPLANATLTITDSRGLTWTLQSAADGAYQFWLDEIGSPVTVTVAAAGHASGMATGIVISGGMTSTLNFNVRQLQPCVSVAPSALAVTLMHGAHYTTALRISNTGAQASDVQLCETPDCLPGDAIPWLHETPVTGTVSADGQLDVDVAFDGSVVIVGTHFATLTVMPQSLFGAISIPVSLTVIPTGMYTSIAAGNWSDLNNWRGHPPALPTAADDVIIAAGAPITVDTPSACANLTIEYGAELTIPTGLTLTVEATAVNSGALTHVWDVNGGVPARLAHLLNSGGEPVYHGILVAAAGNMGLVTTTIRGRQACTTAGIDDTVNRCFNITPAIVPGDGVTLTFYFAASEIPFEQTCATLEVYHHDGTTWSAALSRDLTYGLDGRDCSTEPYSIRVTGVTDFSPFALRSGGAPAAVRKLAARARRVWNLAPVLALSGAAVALRRKRR